MTISDFKDFIMRRLGSPAINIEIDDEQLDDCIDEAISLFKESHYNGSDIQFIKLNVEAGTNEYILDADISSVVKIYGSNNNISVTDENLLVEKPYVGNTYSNVTNSAVDYAVTLQSLEMINDQYKVDIYYDFNEVTKKLFIHNDIETTETYLLKVYKSATNESLFNDTWLKKYAVAVAGVQWSVNISKYDGNLPSGMTLNYRDIEARYLAQIEKLEQELEDKYSAPPQFFTG